METQKISCCTEKLRNLALKPEMRRYSKADKLTILAAVLHLSDPQNFEGLNNLTWPEGQAILLSNQCQNIERTNTTAQIKPIPKSDYLIDTGHDNAAMRRLVEMMMRHMGVELGVINQCKALFQVKQRSYFTGISLLEMGAL